MPVDYNSLAARMLTQMALVNASISTVGKLQEASPIVLRTVYVAVQSALVPFTDAIAAYDADIDNTTVGGVTVGPAQIMAASLLNQTADVEQQATLVIAAAYVSRAGVNVNNSPG